MVIAHASRKGYCENEPSLFSVILPVFWSKVYFTLSHVIIGTLTNSPSSMQRTRISFPSMLSTTPTLPLKNSCFTVSFLQNITCAPSFRTRSFSTGYKDSLKTPSILASNMNSSPFSSWSFSSFILLAEAL